MDLAAQLRELRVRAGDPSIRSIERLIARQGRQSKMARSTIQDKLSGTSPLNLPQVLSIVEALGEHARLNDAPLPQEEIDQSIWRERTSAAKKEKEQASQAHMKILPSKKISWDSEPLEQAHLHDLVQIVTDSAHLPAAGWLPGLLREMIKAGMTVTEFITRASEEDPLSVVRTLAALEDEFPYVDSQWGRWAATENNMTVGMLLRLTAQRVGDTASPAIVAGLRRSDVGLHVERYLIEVGVHLPPDRIEKAVDHLRSATLQVDAQALLSGTGTHRSSNELAAVVIHFQTKGKVSDRDTILAGVAKASWFHARDVFLELEKSSAPRECLWEVAKGVPYGKHAEYAQNLQDANMELFAELVRKAASEPPF
ncbi:MULTISPECIES: hypothetical protein [unclassified Streptomyces]|uniref:hypothetical protein n=1 Tax=unclassified Streptomyces TaxID=2593676 RepID=UPI001319D159|nr:MULTISPECIES: hypothetical protein [unclassified Streptomyces]MYY05036.1 hypothetical protein [Streptomyces sp. SID4913]